MRTYSVVVAFCLVLSPIGASAQDTSKKTRLIISERAIAAGTAATPPPAPSRGNDSLKNGAIIGAIVGAAVFGGYVTFLCNALREPGHPSCLGSSMLAIGMGAGIGAAGGAGIDWLAASAPSRRPRNRARQP